MHQTCHNGHKIKMYFVMLGEVLKQLEGRLEEFISLEVLEKVCRNDTGVLATTLLPGDGLLQRFSVCFLHKIEGLQRSDFFFFFTSIIL